MTDQDQNPTIQVDRLEEDFTMLSRHLLQDPDISMDAQGVATFLLSLPKVKKNGTPWEIYPKHVWKSKNIGRDRVYKAINELCCLGYMKKEVEKRGNLNGKTTYFISSLKKYLRDPGSQDNEAQDSPGQDYKKIEEKKDIHKKETTTPEGEKEVVVLFKEEILKKTPLTVAQRKKLAKEKSSVPDDVFEQAILAYLQYAKENEIGNHMSTVTKAINAQWTINIDTKEAAKKRAREQEKILDGRKEIIRYFKHKYENNRFWSIERGHFVTFTEELTNSFTYKFKEMEKSINVSYLSEEFDKVIEHLKGKLSVLVAVR